MCNNNGIVDYFKDFIEDEFKWIYEDEDIVNNLVESFDGRISVEEVEDLLDNNRELIIDCISNDEWLIQQIHERMDDFVFDAIKDYLNNREQ